MSIVLVAILALLILMISISWTNNRGAPWVPSSMNRVHTMLQMAEVGPDDLLYDLGCGDGRILVAAAREYGARAVGIEIDPLRYLYCQILITLLGLRDRVRLVYGDFFSQDLSPANVVTCYLLQDTNRKLESKFSQELRPGARVVSNYFSFPGLYKVRQEGKTSLYLANFAEKTG